MSSQRKTKGDVQTPKDGEAIIAHLKRLVLDITSHSQHTNCPDCPPIPKEDVNALFQVVKNPNLQFCMRLLTWAEKQRFYARGVVCPPSDLTPVLYGTGKCDHKFCAECNVQRNQLDFDYRCCVCDVQFKAKNIHIDNEHTYLALQILAFISVVKQVIEEL